MKIMLDYLRFHQLGNILRMIMKKSEHILQPLATPNLNQNYFSQNGCHWLKNIYLFLKSCIKDDAGRAELFQQIICSLWRY